MKATGKTTSPMASAFKLGQMVANTKATTNQARSKAGVITFGQTNQPTMEIGRTGESAERELISMWMGECMKGNSETT